MIEHGGNLAVSVDQIKKVDDSFDAKLAGQGVGEGALAFQGEKCFLRLAQKS